MSGGLPDFGTYAPVLSALIAKTKGPILELGSGDHSTPLLHLVSDCCGREVVTAETDPVWLSKYENYRTSLHSLHLITKNPTKGAEVHQWQAGWDEWKEIEKRQWSVALIDQAPGECRASTIRRLKGRCEYIVAHDSEKDYDVGTNYGYEAVIPLFKHVWEWRRFRPYTLVLSDQEIFGFQDLAWKP